MHELLLQILTELRLIRLHVESRSITRLSPEQLAENEATVRDAREWLDKQRDGIAPCDVNVSDITLSGTRREYGHIMHLG